MNIDEMYPPKWLTPADISNRPTEVEIEKVDYEHYERDDELVFYVVLRGYRRPLKLNKSRSKAISRIIGTKETDEWGGMFITLMPAQTTIHGTVHHYVEVWEGERGESSPAHNAGQHPPRHVASTSRQLPEARDMRPWGPEAQKRALAAMKEADKDWTMFLTWLKQNEHADALAQAFGVDIYEMPAWIMPLFAEFVGGVMAPPEPEAAPAAPAPPEPVPVSQNPINPPPAIDPDDIPF